MAPETPLRVHQVISAKAQEPLHQGISAKAQEPFASRHKCESTGSLAHAPSTVTPGPLLPHYPRDKCRWHRNPDNWSGRQAGAKRPGIMPVGLPFL